VTRMTKTVLVALTGFGMAFTASAALAAGDPAKGEKDFKRCAICHKLEEGGKGIGPSLAGIVGRQAGTVSDYKYSPDYVEAGQKGLKWEPEQLIAYLEDPREFLKSYLKKDSAKSKMLQKFKDMQFREDVVVYLQSLQKK